MAKNISNNMKPTPKFKKGDTIYFKSNWFAGSYIPDMMVVFGIRVAKENGEWHVKYRKRGVRWEIDEREAFATEAEAQQSEARRFYNDTRNQLQELLAESRREGIEGEVTAFLTNTRLIGNDEADNKTPLKVGQTVWGYLDKAHGSSYIPGRYVISEVLKHEDEYFYRVRGHGTYIVNGTNLHPTREAAIMSAVYDLARDVKGRVYSIGKTCQRLQIEFRNPLLLE